MRLMEWSSRTLCSVEWQENSRSFHLQAEIAAITLPFVAVLGIPFVPAAAALVMVVVLSCTKLFIFTK